jgi:hypothetical protein
MLHIIGNYFSQKLKERERKIKARTGTSLYLGGLGKGPCSAK